MASLLTPHRPLPRAVPIIAMLLPIDLKTYVQCGVNESVYFPSLKTPLRQYATTAHVTQNHTYEAGEAVMS